MEDLFDMNADLFEEPIESQLLLQIDADSENRFLEKIGGENARERDLVAFVDQYAATGITMLCFPLCNEKHLPVWLDRCRKVGLKCALTVSCEQAETTALYADLQTDAIIVDGRGIADFSCLSALPEKFPHGHFILLTDNTDVADADAYDTVIVCAEKRNCCKSGSELWLAKKENCCVLTAVCNYLCNENDTDWYPTPEILNGFAVSVLAKGFDGIYLDGFCADPFDADSALYDIFDTCGNFSDAVGARRRHLYDGDLPVELQAGADMIVPMTLGPVFEGAAVCVLVGTDHEDAVSVFVNDKETEKTGIPAIVARNAKGREYENTCISKTVKCAEFFAPHDELQDVVNVRIHNNTNKTIFLSWFEVTVNI